ncbi:MAG TPA: HAD family hydrolase [bacterium]
MIFFDLDDTLLDHETAARAGATNVFKSFRSCFKEDLETFLVRWHNVSEKYFQSNSKIKYELWEERRLRMRELFSVEFSDEEAESRFEVYLEAYEADWRLFPDAIPCLRALQYRKLGLITNGEGEQQRSKILKLGLGDYFQTVIISREVNCAKPEKAIFELAARQAGVAIKDCVYVGDRLQADARSSQQAGMRGIWLNRKANGEDQGFEVPVIRNLMELPSLL